MSLKAKLLLLSIKCFGTIGFCLKLLNMEIPPLGREAVQKLQITVIPPLGSL
jgi:hypothetical protein